MFQQPAGERSRLGRYEPSRSELRRPLELPLGSDLSFRLARLGAAFRPPRSDVLDATVAV